jgi:hypothetical protein
MNLVNWGLECKLDSSRENLKTKDWTLRKARRTRNIELEREREKVNVWNK